MSKMLSYMFLLSCAVGLQILVYIYGWGMHPRSWWWILCGGVVGFTVIQLGYDALRKEDKNG